jgi:SAM-dependent methyltransferase
MSTNGYNERLFSSGLRGELHQARYRWLSRSLEKMGCRSRRVIELGCFDGKSIDFLPNKPRYYLGLDANWEGGLDIARERWKDHPEYDFQFCATPEDIHTTERFDICICMETLEHVNPGLVEPYLEVLARLTRQYIFITVPNEKGPLFAFKHSIKKIFGLPVEKYSLREFIYAAMGRMHRVRRNEHKGFDYARLILSKFFTIVEVSSLPYSWLPRWMTFGIGVIAKPKKRGKSSHVGENTIAPGG